MTIDAAAVGRRIKQARLDRGMKTPRDLAECLQRRLGEDKPHRETVRLWEAGAHIPPYEMIELLAIELDLSEEGILFGIDRRGIQQDRYLLEHVSEDELRLLNYYRHTAPDYRPDVIGQAELAAKRHPAPLAEVKPLRKR